MYEIEPFWLERRCQQGRPLALLVSALERTTADNRAHGVAFEVTSS